MVTIKAPRQYVNEFGIRRDAGKYLVPYGKRIVLIAGRRAAAAVRKEIEESLRACQAEYRLLFFEGQPTARKVSAYAVESRLWNADLVVGIGGGKVCDLAKAVADETGIPAAAIPTVAATCACWAARSILYEENGRFDQIRWNQNSPVLVLSDTEILMGAPRRYLAAGILDTLAKWYEFAPLLPNYPCNTVLEHDLLVGKYAFDLLMHHGRNVYEGSESRPEIQKQVIDAIFYLAGASGSFAGEQAFRGFAHPVYFESTGRRHADQYLHGERVAYGLLVQFLLQEKPQEEIDQYLELLAAYHMSHPLTEWGIADEEITELAGQIYEKWPAVRSLSFVSGADRIAQSIRQADRLLVSG